MKTAAMMTMAAMLGSVAWAAAKSDDQKVVACFEVSGGDAMEVAVAKMTASALFQSAGVKLEWHTDRRSCKGQRDQVILVSLSMATPLDLHPGALAYVLPYEGVHIQVFYDRIANRAGDLRPNLLAYAVVHEITHILQAIDRHSDSGIMKAHWDSPEHELMMGSRLRFADEDIVLIQNGLAARAARRAPGTLVGSVLNVRPQDQDTTRWSLPIHMTTEDRLEDRARATYQWVSDPSGRL